VKRIIFGLAASALIANAGVALAWPFGGVSGTLIPPGQTFLLGGGKNGAFKINACNTGTVAVEVSRQTDQTSSPITTLKPGACVDQAFAFGEMATLRNTSNAIEASLKIKINRSLNSLSMRYRSGDGQ